MAKCLRPRGIPVRAVQGALIVFENGSRREEMILGVGCYLTAPGREAKIVRALAGPSSLVVLCPAAASVYFGAAECCPNGTVLSDEFRCEG